VPLQTWKDYLTFGTSAAYADYLPAAFVDVLIRNLLAALKAGIDDLEWMSPATKVQVQATLAKYSLKIAYPYRWRQDDRCALPSTSGAEPDVSPRREQDEAVGAAAATREFLRPSVTPSDV